jgi:hypothetical protein
MRVEFLQMAEMFNLTSFPFVVVWTPTSDPFHSNKVDDNSKSW